MSEEASNEVVQVHPQRQQCEPHGLDEPRDPEINHRIPVLRLTVKYPRLLMTLMSQWLINSLKNNTKDKLLFDTSCTICTTGLHRAHELTKCSGWQLTNKGTK